jgi:hypothetical protein
MHSTEDASQNKSVPVAGAVPDLNTKTPDYGPQDRQKCQQQIINQNGNTLKSGYKKITKINTSEYYMFSH